MKYDKIVDLILSSNNIVFFGGAGVSTESGIPDFRSATGLYNKKNDMGYTPEYMLSHEFLEKHPEEFSEYYKNNLIAKGVKPNITHRVLARLEKMGKLKAIVTQNIDSLHQMAGSKNVYELHGNLRDYYCIKCGKKYDMSYVLKNSGANYCSCTGYIRPDVTLYGEMPDQEVFKQAIYAISQSDVLIIAGTSLSVYPAAGLLKYYRGDKAIFINKDKVINTDFCKYQIYDSMGNLFEEINERLGSE